MKAVAEAVAKAEAEAFGRFPKTMQSWEECNLDCCYQKYACIKSSQRLVSMLILDVCILPRASHEPRGEKTC